MNTRQEPAANVTARDNNLADVPNKTSTGVSTKMAPPPRRKLTPTLSLRKLRQQRQDGKRSKQERSPEEMEAGNHVTTTHSTGVWNRLKNPLKGRKQQEVSQQQPPQGQERPVSSTNPDNRNKATDKPAKSREQPNPINDKTTTKTRTTATRPNADIPEYDLDLRNYCVVDDSDISSVTTPGCLKEGIMRSPRSWRKRGQAISGGLTGTIIGPFRRTADRKQRRGRRESLSLSPERLASANRNETGLTKQASENSGRTGTVTAPTVGTHSKDAYGTVSESVTPEGGYYPLGLSPYPSQDSDDVRNTDNDNEVAASMDAEPSTKVSPCVSSIDTAQAIAMVNDHVFHQVLAISQSDLQIDDADEIEEELRLIQALEESEKEAKAVAVPAHVASLQDDMDFPPLQKKPPPTISSERAHNEYHQRLSPMELLQLHDQEPDTKATKTHEPELYHTDTYDDGNDYSMDMEDEQSISDEEMLQNVETVLEVFPDADPQRVYDMLEDGSVRAVLGRLAEESNNDVPPDVLLATSGRDTTKNKTALAVDEDERSIRDLVLPPSLMKRRSSSCPNLTNQSKESRRVGHSSSNQLDIFPDILQDYKQSAVGADHKKSHIHTLNRPTDVQRIQEIFPTTDEKRADDLLTRHSLSMVLAILASESTRP